MLSLVFASLSVSDPAFAASAAAVPPGAAADDLTDATALLFIAERHATGLSVPFPDPPLKDAFGLPVAIWT